MEDDRENQPDESGDLDAANAEEDVTAEVLLERALTPEEFVDLTAADARPADVTFSSQDFDVAGLVRRLQAESMLIPSHGTTDDRLETEGFQRGFVWTKAQMDRFIETLLLGFPVPAIFLVKQARDNRLLVLDGQQRLTTLRRFYEGVHKAKPFALGNVADEFKGLTYASLPDPLRFKLDDSYMQATIVAADGSAELNEAVYQIFERLNSGGTQLTPHEIRVALAAGELITFIERLNQLPAWRGVYGNKSSRLRDQELVLRIIALYLDSASYSRPLKSFLNSFASSHRMPGEAVTQTGTLFEEATAHIAAAVGPTAFRRPGGNQVNMAQAEAVTVAVMRAIAATGQAPDDLGARLDVLKASEDFGRATTRATADNDSVALRLNLATREIAGV